MLGCRQHTHLSEVVRPIGQAAKNVRESEAQRGRIRHPSFFRNLYRVVTKAFGRSETNTNETTIYQGIAKSLVGF